MPSVGEVVRVRYEITGLLQQGAIFNLYAAKDRVLGRPVSLRFFNPPLDKDTQFIEAVSQCSKKASIISHPGVERIEGLDVDGDVPFLVGQLSTGTCLTERIRRLAPFSVSVAVGHAVSILEALASLHAAQIVHGDLQSDNIVIGPDGSAKLQLAGIWPAYRESPIAGAIVLPSMAPYLAPETGKGHDPSMASDVYAVGISLYTLLCGRLPYNAESPIAVALQHSTVPSPSIRSYVPSAPVVLDEIVKKAMSKDVGDRYLNANQMLSDLRMLQDALRFGKTLTWPILKVSAQPSKPNLKPNVQPNPLKSNQTSSVPLSNRNSQSTTSGSGQTSSSQRVAPRMGALNEDGRKMRRSGQDQDVPTWLLLAISALIGVIVMGAISIWLWFNITRPKMITMPNIVGRDVGQARSSLEGLGLQLRQISETSNSRIPAQAIIQSDPPAGEHIRTGGIVNVTVSTGSSQLQTPDLHGLTIDQALTMLKSDNLGLSQPVLKVPSSTIPEGQIVSQNPKSGKTIAINTMISVSVSTGPPPTPPPPSASTSPSSTNSTNPTGSPSTTTATTSGVTGITGNDSQDQATAYHLTITLNDVTHAVMLRVDMKDAHGTSTILSEVHDAGDKVPITAVGYGSKATFRIYYDDALVKTIVERAKPATPGSAGGQ